jgi:hypothetical protein
MASYNEPAYATTSLSDKSEIAYATAIRIKANASVKKSFMSMARMGRPGGQLAVDSYPKTLKAILHWWKYRLADNEYGKRLPMAVLTFGVRQGPLISSTKI